VANSEFLSDRAARLVRNIILCSFSFLIVFQIKQREDNRCAVTGTFDYQQALTLQSQGKIDPTGIRHLSEAAHILQFKLIQFPEDHELVGPDTLSLSNLPTAWSHNLKDSLPITNQTQGFLLVNRLATEKGSSLSCVDIQVHPQHLDS